MSAKRGTNEATETGVRYLEVGPPRMARSREEGHPLPRFKVTWLIAAGVAILMAGPFLGTHEIQVVLSSSMEPTLHAGDVAVVAHTSPQEIEEGDVLTFHPPGEDIMVSHRVVAINQTDDGPRFQTHGDAVEEPDPYQVRPSDVVGTVVFTIPGLGYAIHGLQTGNPALLVAFIVVPAAALIWGEVKTILRELEVLKEEEDPPPRELRRRNLAMVAAVLTLGGAAATAPFLMDVGPLPNPEAGGHPLPGMYGARLPDQGYVRPEVVGPWDQPEVRSLSSGELTAAPRVLPAFWLAGLAEAHVLLPPVAAFATPPAVLTLLARPLWYRPVHPPSPEGEREGSAGDGDDGGGEGGERVRLELVDVEGKGG